MVIYVIKIPQLHHISRLPIKRTPGQSSVDSLGRLRLLGEVTNIGADDAYFVRATVSFYDATGALVGVGLADTNPRTIAPGKTAPFDLVAEVDADEVVRYRVSVE